MKKHIQVQKAKAILNGAIQATLNIAPNDKNMQAARSHLRQSINCMDKFIDSETKKKSNTNHFESWWNNIVSGTAKMSQSQFSSEANARSLKKLQSMIDEEESKITDMEKEISEFDNNESNQKFLVD